ncbi:MAG: hypothetical protein GF390_03035 [Candidatus Pacebacteria bacterium]|nr:hypothetical protein [Candidatus Paceibacterota bacterium]
MIKISLFLLFLPLIFIRWLRWLAIVQQKEYRWDRLKLFFYTHQGQQDFWRLLPRLSDFSRTGLKRPVRTKRVLLIALLSLGLLAGWAYVITTAVTVVETLILLLIIYHLIPLWIWLATLPTTVLAWLFTFWALKKAARKITQAQPQIIGLTGSYGKTSTKLLLAAVLAQKYSVFVTPKSHNTKLSIAQSINQDFQDQEIAILEYAAYTPGEIRLLAKYFPPQLAVITGLTAQHLGLFGSIQQLIQAKAELVSAIQDQVFCQAADPGAVEICQAGQARSQVKSKGKSKAQSYIAYTGKAAKLKLTQVGLNDQGKLYFSWQGRKIQTQLVGKHYLASVQAAIIVAQYLKLSFQQISQGLIEFKPDSCFIQIRQSQNQVMVIDDGQTSNPQGFLAALELAQHFKTNNKKVVLLTSGIVDLGEQSNSIHHQLAKQAKTIVDLVLYAGSAGRPEFAAVFGQKLISNQAKIKAQLTQLDQHTVLLIEGKITADLLAVI